MTELKKPQKHIVEHWDYTEIINYIETKYNIRTRDYAGRWQVQRDAVAIGDEICGDNSWYRTTKDQMTEKQEEASAAYNKYCQDNVRPYQDFWHLYCDEIAGNGSYMWLSFEPLFEEYDPDDPYSYPDWAKEILRLIKDEFAPGENEWDLKCWVEW